MFARIVCAVYWFHPMARWAEREMRLESERACDDAVIRAGFCGIDYAQQLVDLAKNMPHAHATLAAELLRPSEIEQRLKDILDNSRNRSPIKRNRAILAAILAAGVLIPIAALRLTASQFDACGVLTVAPSEEASAGIVSSDQRGAKPQVSDSYSATLSNGYTLKVLGVAKRQTVGKGKYWCSWQPDGHLFPGATVGAGGRILEGSTVWSDIDAYYLPIPTGEEKKGVFPSNYLFISATPPAGASSKMTMLGMIKQISLGDDPGKKYNPTYARDSLSKVIVGTTVDTQHEEQMDGAHNPIGWPKNPNVPKASAPTFAVPLGSYLNENGAVSYSFGVETGAWKAVSALPVHIEQGVQYMQATFDDNDVTIQYDDKRGKRHQLRLLPIGKRLKSSSVICALNFTYKNGRQVNIYQGGYASRVMGFGANYSDFKKIQLLTRPYAEVTINNIHLAPYLY
jgi:hypothetical protein